jgi:hypothetical protein
LRKTSQIFSRTSSNDLDSSIELSTRFLAEK